MKLTNIQSTSSVLIKSSNSHKSPKPESYLRIVTLVAKCLDNLGAKFA